jgi:hypothetical protein
MSTFQTTPVIPPGNDVEPREEELGLMVIEESAPLRLPAAEGVGFDSGRVGITAMGTEHRWSDV